MGSAGLLVTVIVIALGFDYINGFHDTANAIATVVSTRVMRPRTAILMAACLNFLGALLSTKVAYTIAKDIVDPTAATQVVVLAALLGAILWNLITWRLGIPSSSSHALIGGVIGAGATHAGFSVMHWPQITIKVVIPIFASPMAGFLVGFIVMSTIYVLFRHTHSGKVARRSKVLQVFSAAFMALSHGMNDAQKTMGIITLALLGHGILRDAVPPIWVILAAATAMAFGTTAGGWRIMKTMGHQIFRLRPIDGFAAETAAGLTIVTASHFGMPISTTHVISGSIFGVGSSQRLKAVRWGVGFRMIYAWLLTLPCSAGLAALFYFVLALIFNANAK